MTGAIRAAIERAIARRRKVRAARLTCPECSKESALLTLSFEGLLLGRLCRFCPWTSFGVKAKR
jgi:hypothetical protein